MYYLALNQKKAGPFTVEQIRDQLKNGMATPQTLFWQDGQAGWEPLANLGAVLDAAPTPGAPTVAAAAPVPAVSAMPASTPAYAAAAYPGQAASPGGPAFVQAPPTSGAAIASLVCGILGVFGFFFIFIGLPISLAAIISGHIGRSNIKKSDGRLGGNGAALAGLVLGYLTLLADLIQAALLIGLFVYAVNHPDKFTTPTPEPTTMISTPCPIG